MDALLPRLYGTRYADDGTTTLYAVDPESGAETILASGVPEGNLAIAPTEDFAILTTYVDGPTEGDVYQVLEPEDRQPGWRKRARLWRVDFASGITTPVTFGFRQLYLNDIADDGSKILVTTARSRYEQRPHYPPRHPQHRPLHPQGRHCCQKRRICILGPFLARRIIGARKRHPREPRRRGSRSARRAHSLYDRRRGSSSSTPPTTASIPSPASLIHR